MDINELVLSRQSCRNFNDKTPDIDLLKKICELALNAPSACNSQPWKLYLVTNEDKVKQVALSVQDFGMNKFASNAKAFIVVAEQDAMLKSSSSLKFDNNHFVKYDVGEIIAYLTLIAKAEGLETCILGWVNGKKLKSAVGYQDNETCNIVIAVGYSDGEVRHKIRKPVSEKLTVI